MAEAQSQLPRRAGFLLLLTVFLSGAAVLLIQILGTRLLSPYFGSNLYVWSALISVTLTALALGYWLGGRVADRRGSPALLDSILSGAAFLIAVAPILVHATARRLFDVPFEAAILIAAVTYFGPALLLLGMVSPVAVRLSVRDLGHVGRSVGSIFGWSTAGGIVGALAAGFVLLPHLSVSRICYATAATLLALAGGRFVARQWRTYGGPAAAVLLLAVGSLVALSAAPYRVREERGFRVVVEKPSFYGTIRVVEDGRYRYLLIDGSVQAWQTAGGYPTFPYAWTVSVLPYLRSQARKALLIGLGAGDLIRLFKHHGIEVTAVEVDPAVAQTAMSHFGLRRGALQLVIDDGRRYLSRQTGSFDFLVVDAYSGSCPAMHLFTQEAFAEMKAKLRPGGVLAVNVVVQNHYDALAADVSTTLATAFRHRLALPTDKDPLRLGNVLLFASDEPLELPEKWNPPPISRVHTAFLDGLRYRILDLERLRGTVIRDEYNLVDLRSAPTDIKVRGTYRAYFPPSVLH